MGRGINHTKLIPAVLTCIEKEPILISYMESILSMVKWVGDIVDPAEKDRVITDMVQSSCDRLYQIVREEFGSLARPKVKPLFKKGQVTITQA